MPARSNVALNYPKKGKLSSSLKSLLQTHPQLTTQQAQRMRKQYALHFFCMLWGDKLTPWIGIRISGAAVAWSGDIAPHGEKQTFSSLRPAAAWPLLRAHSRPLLSAWLPCKANLSVQGSFTSTCVWCPHSISKNKQKAARCVSSPTFWKQKPSENSRRILACVNNSIFFHTEQVRIEGFVGTGGSGWKGSVIGEPIFGVLGERKIDLESSQDIP